MRNSSPQFAPLFTEAIEAFNRITKSAGISSFLVGAFARDLIFHHSGRALPARKTKDIDFAVMVDTWGDLKQLKNLLLGGER